MGETILTINYLLNKVSRKKIKKKAYELWNKRKSFYKYLQAWSVLGKF